ncbi:MAG: hypothetical protein QM765_26660 [Myxococcales bacterium]
MTCARTPLALLGILTLASAPALAQEEAPAATPAAPAPAAEPATTTPAPAAAAPVENSADLFAAPSAQPAAAASPATADAPAFDASSAAAPAFVLKFKGAHEFAFHQPAYGDVLDYAGEMKSPAFRNALGLEARYGTLKLVSDWRLDLLLNRGSATTDGLATGFDNGQRGAWDGLARIRPLENYLSWSPKGTGLKISAGYQTFAWGAADQINPTDNLNPRDYTMGVMDAAKIPVLAADVTWYPTDSLSIEGVYVPVDQPYRFPVDYATEVQGALGLTNAVQYQDLKLGPGSFVAGGRLAYRGAVDASLSYLYDWDQYYVASVGGRLYNPLRNAQVTLRRARLHRVGADLKTTLGSFGLWAEGAANFTEHSNESTLQRHWWVDYVAGLDTSFGPNDKAYVNLQYVGSVVPDFDESPFDVTQAMNPKYGEAYYRRLLASSLGFQTAQAWQGATLDLKVTLFDGIVTPEVRAVYLIPVGYDDSAITHHGSLALNPEIDIAPMDAFHILVGADLAWSWIEKKGVDGLQLDTTGDRIGEFTRFNNVYLKLAYQWDLEAKK